MESKTFIEDLFTYGKAGTCPIDPLPLIQRLSLSLAMTINWGLRVPSHKDKLFREIVEVEEELNRFRSTTGNLQDYIPLLRLNPINKASAKAREMRDRRDHYLRTLNNELAEKVQMGTNKPCIQANVIKFKEEKLSDVELISISLSVLGGGFETVSNTVQFTMAFLAQQPDIQEKAYQAIREFQGSDNPLCNAADDQKCAYINGLAKEALRYFTVIPLNLPRQSIKQVEYNGIVIPEGTTFYMNALACNYGKWPSLEHTAVTFLVDFCFLSLRHQTGTCGMIRKCFVPSAGWRSQMRRSFPLVLGTECAQAICWHPASCTWSS